MLLLALMMLNDDNDDGELSLREIGFNCELHKKRFILLNFLLSRNVSDDILNESITMAALMESLSIGNSCSLFPNVLNENPVFIENSIKNVL